MNIVEALKLSNKIKCTFDSKERIVSFYDYFSTPVFSYTEITSDNWEPVLPEKKTVKKKFYQAVFYAQITKRFFISENIFESPEAAETHARDCYLILVRFLVENPIEVEVEE